MVTERIQAIVLAAGKSSRFNASASKLIFTLCGHEIIVYPIQVLTELSIPTTVVVGYQKVQIKALLQNYNFTSLTYSEQTEQLGTGHAVLSTRHLWMAEHILVINGDMPLINQDIVQKLINIHYAKNATISFVIAHNSDSTLGSYGRIVRENNTITIVEAKDFTQDPHEYPYINAGIYIIKRNFLEEALYAISKNNLTGELYLTDIVLYASSTGKQIETILAPFDQVRGVNTLKELWIAEHIKRSTLIEQWMQLGVRFIAPQTVHIDASVTIGKDTTVGAGVQLRNGTTIGQQCFIDAYSIIENSSIADNTSIYSHSVITNAQISNNAKIGPFAHVHGQSILHAHTVVGNFVEISKSIVGEHTKAKHLAYIGQAHIGSEVTIGAGTITCNYNGVSKHRTTIKNNAFIGSNVVLVAPITIEENALIGAGSVITQDVPANALALERNLQIIKENYAPKLKEKYKKRIKNTELERL